MQKNVGKNILVNQLLNEIFLLIIYNYNNNNNYNNCTTHNIIIIFDQKLKIATNV